MPRFQRGISDCQEAMAQALIGYTIIDSVLKVLMTNSINVFG